MTGAYAHLGDYSDWVAASGAQRGTTPDLAAVRRALASALRLPAEVAPRSEEPEELRCDRGWEADGLAGEEVSWSTGFGPRTTAWVLKPKDADGPLPGILALHGHDGFKYYGKEKIADGPDATPPVVRALRAGYYGGRAFANDLAREGYVVVVPDAFGWGSRRFRFEQMPPLIQRLGELTAGEAPPDVVDGPVPPHIATYNAAAWHHENVLEKYCRLLGTTFAAVVARDDRIALDYLSSRPDVSGRTGSIGLSGGGCRSVLLRATRSDLTAAVVVGMMSTYDALLDHNVVDHTWMLFPDLGPDVDWPDVAAASAPAALLVQYDRDDTLLPLPGASAAHARITEHYTAAAAPEQYEGQFYDGPHKFDHRMQRAAYDWLHRQLHQQGPGPLD